jgi:hypothetical protein
MKIRKFRRMKTNPCPELIQGDKPPQKKILKNSASLPRKQNKRCKMKQD